MVNAMFNVQYIRCQIIPEVVHSKSSSDLENDVESGGISVFFGACGPEHIQFNRGLV